MRNELKLGQTLSNGATLVNFKTKDALTGEQVVLATMPYQVMPFVTWRRNPRDGGCYHGHYFADLAKAVTDFNAR